MISLNCRIALAVTAAVAGGLAGCANSTTATPASTASPAATLAAATSTPMPTPTPCAYADADRDGLSDSNEALAGTDVGLADTDADGISDYDETTKYLLNPLLADSDGDGAQDNEPIERREYASTLRAVIAVRRPYDIETMNDHFQDATIVSETPDMLTFEVVFYPNSYHIVEEIPWAQASEWYGGMEEYLQPDAAMNFDAEMSQETSSLFASSEARSDLQVVKNMYSWTNRNIRGTGDSEPFLDLVVTEDGRVVFPRPPHFNPNSEYTEWDMTHLILGKESFFNRTHGSCGSIANLHSTILRSLGIPTRIIQTIPLLNGKSEQQRKLLETLSPGTRAAVADGGGNHFLVEAFIGNRWLRVNNDSYENRVPLGFPFIKVVAFSSWSQVDFANPWGRWWPPYELLEVDEQPPVHESLQFGFED